MKRAQQGFTLIELMIVVAIIGILAAIAIPAYQDYTKRAHVSEGLQLAGAAKTAIAEYYSSNNVFPASNGPAGLASPTEINGNAVDSVTVSTSASQGIISIDYKSVVDDAAVLVLTASATNGGAFVWDCSASGTMQAKWVPSNCR
ncbi:pilin [Vogesella facilis]|uniref:Pilin n=1 Tax=Vogesella facilis TaxID=1655232 RepID=A0ABV7RE54_9NEIS